MDLTVCTHGPEAREALWRAVGDAKGGDPLAPVTVAVPSPYAGLSLRRSLTVRPGASGLVNVRFMPLARVAELLGAPALAGEGRRPLTPPLRAEAVRATLAEHTGPLAAVAHHPATESALDATLRELRRADPRAADRLARQGARGAVVASLYHRFRERTRPYYDEEDAARAAAAAPADAPAAIELGHVVLHLPRRLTPAEAVLVEALADRGRLSVILGLTGDGAADQEARDLAASLARPGARKLAAPDPEARLGTGVISAPDPEEEVREVARAVMARARAGTPLHRIALLYRSGDPYARLAREVLDAAGLPWSGPSTRRLAGSVAGRVLLGMLRLRDDGFRRDTVTAWLAAGPLLDPSEGRVVPAARWDLLSRRAGVVVGLDQWEARLARLERERSVQLEAARADVDATEGTRRRLESDVTEAARLRAFVADLASRLTPPEPATWPRLAAWARDLVTAYLGGEGRRARWPEAELDAARRVLAALVGLDTLAEIRATADVQVFVRALESELDTPASRVGTFGHGLFVGPLYAAAGTDYDVVYVVGMAEGVFPPRGPEDPLLPDADREAAGGSLTLHNQRHADERHDYLAALAAAPERVLSFPRADPRAQRKRLPARWLVETAAALAGRRVGAAELAALPANRWLRVVESAEHGMCDRGGEPSSPTERDVRALRSWQRSGRRLDRHPLVGETPSLAAGVSATAARRSALATRFDGVVGPVPGLPPADGAAWSPTALEDWATCPFRFLLGRVLRVREVERPEEAETLSPLDRGTLVHGVLEDFLRSTEPPVAPGEPWADADRERLRAIAERHCDAAEAEGRTGRPLPWKLERRRILRELAGVLDVDEEIRAELGVVPVHGGQEVAFGAGGDPAVTVTIAGGRSVTFRGRIDRIDQSPDGSRVVVFDYKSGSRRGYGDAHDDLARGTRLQLPVYGLAARRDHPDADVHAYYWFVAYGPEDALYGYPLEDAHDDFADVLATVLDGVGAGVFPAYPGAARQDAAGRDTWTNCCYCPYDRLCPPARDDVWERKAADPAVVAFRSLAEPEKARG